MENGSTWYAIINPVAGKGRSRSRWDQLKRRLLRASIPFQEAISTARGHMSTLAAEARAAGYNQFISVGGDGSHHEVINGLLRNADSFNLVPTVAILSGGSGNDWARTHHLPHHADDCIDLIRQRHAVSHPAGMIRYERLGQTHQRYFINVAGMALDGSVVESFPEVFKNIPLLPGYLIAGIKQLLFYRAPQAGIQGADASFKGRFLTINAGIGKYSGGGMQFVPHADPSRSDFAITCIARMPKVRLFGNIYRLYTGSILRHPRVTGFHSATLRVVGDKIPLEADGEFLGYTPVEISFIPDAFRLIVPKR